MFKTDKLLVVIIGLAVAISCVGGALIFYDENPSHSITYEANGGVIDDDSPTSFHTGDYLEIPSPFKEDYVFNAWYLDEELTVPFTGDTTNITSSITLYASWSDSLSGHYVTMTKSGYNHRGYNSYEISGDLTFTYLYYNEDKDSYYVQNTDNTTYHYTHLGTEYSESTSSRYWGSDIDGEWSSLGEETITVTIDGKEVQKECEILRLTYADSFSYKAYETQWIGDGWIPYKIEYYSLQKGFFENYEVNIVYTYLEDGYQKLENDCTIDVVEGDGITVTGNESPYKLGATATLTAKASAGTTFSGWYDSNFELLSDKTTYKFVVGGSQVIYAMNTESEDRVLESDVPLDLDEIFGLTNAKYIITNRDTEAVDTVQGELYTFDNGGKYTIVAEASDGVHKFYLVQVTGGVERTFTWTYDKKVHTLTLDIDYDDYRYANNLYKVSQRQQSSDHVRDKTFVTLSYTDDVMAPYMEELVTKMVLEYENTHGALDEYKYLDYVLRFTQEIEYQSDEEYMGTTEYWKFPLETLYDQGGDCEDTSILFIAIAHQSRADVGKNYQTGLQLLPGHMAGAIKLTSTPSKYSRSLNPYGYAYCETTSTGYSLGDIPSTMTDYFQNSRYYSSSSGYSYLVEIE